jgi:voltage-gated potassium channel
MAIMQAIRTPFNIEFINRFVLYVRQRKYECLLFSFMLLIFGDTFNHQFIVIICNILQNMLTGAFIFYERKRLRNIILLLILASIVLSLLGPHFSFIDRKSWQGTIYLIFFALISKEVYKEVFYTKTVTKELLSAALCGFVLLCLIGTFLYHQIEIEIPHSFSNIGTEREVLKNLNYFSFTTLLTIGYGDITPLSLVAKRAVMLMGLAGHFYTVFITSIIVGKYLSAKKDETSVRY